MNRDKKIQIEKTHQHFIELILMKFPASKLDEIAIEEVMGFGTTIEEKTFDLDGLKAIVELQRKHSEHIELDYSLNPVHRRISADENTAIYVDELNVIMKMEAGSNEIKVRLSCVFEYLENSWKLTHWHGSTGVETEEDPFHLEEWKKQNEKLQKQVEEKTADLSKKNRELEIEAALERVRAKAMSMQKSDDLLEVCQIISDQLESLNVKNIRNVQVAIINESNRTYANYQYFTAYAKTAYEETGYENNPASQGLVHEMQKSANSFFIGSIKGDDLKAFKAWREKYKQFPDPVLDRLSEVFYYFYSIGEGGLGLTTYTAISDNELELFKRFHLVFKLAYRRFIDIQQAEAQAREAEIQLALERVRARTMAMQKSTELLETTSLMATQLNGLGEEIDQITIGVFKEKENLVDIYGTIKGDQLQTLDASIDESYIMDKIYQAWKAGRKSLVIELSGEELVQYNKWRNNFLQKNIYPVDNPEGVWFVNASMFSKGVLGFSSDKQVSQEANELLERFAAVFDLTYTRFLDLKKAEAQAREAKIEAALERARAQSMMMQHSDELDITSQVFHEQLHLLGIESEFSYLWLPNEDKAEHLFWATWQEDQQGKSTFNNKQVVYPLNKSEPAIAECYVAWESGNPVHVNPVYADGVEDYFDEWTELLDGVDKFKAKNYPEGLFYIDAYMKYGCFGIMIRKKLSEHEQHVLHRFSKEFEQTYTRFLDLKKAEGQAREAQLELSLERIRSQVTAMKESSDLFDIVVNMRNEFVGLGHEADYFWHMRWLPDIYKMWMTSDDGSRIGTVITIPKYVHDNIPGLAEWERGDEPVYVLPLDAEGAWDYIENMNTHGHYEKVDPNAPTREDIGHIGGLTFIMARTTHGEIGFGLPGYVADPPQESLDTLVRFAGVFDLAYRRFEDLKSAEHQNRETQIELSLERIRARTMAMQNSEELGQTVQVLFDELKQLGLDDLNFCGIGIMQENSRMEAWTASETKNTGSGLVVGNIDMKQHQLLQHVYTNWEAKKESVHYLLEGKEKVNYFNHINNQQGYKAGRDIAALPERVLANAFYFNEGCLYAFTSEEISPEKSDIYKRFAAVFGQTYRRYLDLQIAETRAREALKQASLDRIRGQIASMRNATDLQQITPLIWNELTALEVPFFRCGVFIVDEMQHHVKVYLTTPEGKSLASLDLDFDMSDLTRSTVYSWRKKEVFQTHWSKKEFISWTEEMMKIRQVKSTEKYLGAETPPESLHLHFIPFAQGMLYVGNNDQLSDEHIDLVKSLADAFSFAYARYQDFVVLEEAKQSMEKALNVLKATQSQLVHAEKMASLGELTAGIAHEIQNPLNFVNNFAEVSTDIIDDLNEEINNNDMEEVKAIAEDLKQNLKKIGHHGQRASSIVKGMLEHSRTGSGEKHPTDINALADEYLRLAYHGLRAKDKSFNADFKLEADDNLPKVNVVPQDMGRVLLNLINNAFHAVNERNLTGFQNLSGLQDQKTHKPTVTVTTKKIGDKIEIRVQDNGPGIPEEIIEKIFQPFFTTKPTGQGTGLGLSLSYDIITKGHGGKLDFESKTGEGTTFIIHLPAIEK